MATIWLVSFFFFISTGTFFYSRIFFLFVKIFLPVLMLRDPGFSLEFFFFIEIRLIRIDFGCCRISWKFMVSEFIDGKKKKYVILGYHADVQFIIRNFRRLAKWFINGSVKKVFDLVKCKSRFALPVTELMFYQWNNL